MKKIVLLFTLAICISATAREKDKVDPQFPGDITNGLPKKKVPAELRALWMYGNFSATEYWTRNPSTYLGNAFQMAIAFKFEENGTYSHYFTSSTALGGIPTYQQSLTKGTVEIDAASKTIRLHPSSTHYKRTRYNQVLEERDLAKEEISSGTSYTYTVVVEPSGTKALYLKLNGTSQALTFLLK